MKNWRKWTAISALCLFAYLATGYQLGVYIWDLTNTEEGVEFLTSCKPSCAGRPVADTLFPISYRWHGFGSADWKIRDISLPGTNPVESMDKKTYVINMTFFWGLKFMGNVLMYFFLIILNLMTWMLLIALAFLNALFAPFGIHI